MSKRNWVCFDCRAAVRREDYTVSDVFCALCSKPLANIGYKIPVPAKRNVRGWEELRAQYIITEREASKRRRTERIKQKHALEREIVRLESRPANAGRSKAVQRLRKTLKGAGA
jgi:hypothetical protein